MTHETQANGIAIEILEMMRMMDGPIPLGNNRNPFKTISTLVRIMAAREAVLRDKLSQTRETLTETRDTLADLREALRNL